MASTPICRCRVLYLGSAVPQATKDGLQGIQDPLRELYPEEGVTGARGIDSWLSVWSNGLLLENVDEKRKRVTRFFPIDSLHYCAAVRHVSIPAVQLDNNGGGGGGSNNNGDVHQRFLPLDSPFARIPSLNNPPLFACILRRTSGIKVLECHAFVCKKEMAANALVRCCFHAYADNTFVKQLETNGGSVISGGPPPGQQQQTTTTTNGTPLAAVNPIQKVEQWQAYVQPSKDAESADNVELASIYDNYDKQKTWPPSSDEKSEDKNEDLIYPEYVSNTLRSNTTLNGYKSHRPRQLSAPSTPPPPPPTSSSSSTTATTLPLTHVLHENENGVRHNNKKHLMKKFPAPKHAAPMRWHSAADFRPMWSASHRFPPPPPLPGAPQGIYSVAPPPPPPPPPPFLPPSMALGRPLLKNGGAAEEAIYVPVAAAGRAFKHGNQLYHPGGFPYADDASYYLASTPSPSTPQPSRTPTPTKYMKKKKDKSNSDSETKYNTGIYRKKGHLNERAFSYSIRQEHRSRSHSSLATLSFNGHTDENKQVSGSSNGHTKENGVKKTNGYHGGGGGGKTRNAAKNDSGLSSDSSLDKSLSPVNGSRVKKNGHDGGELNIKDLHLSDGDDYSSSTLKAKNKNKKMAANKQHKQLINNKQR